MHEVFPDSAEVRNGRLFVGGCDTAELAERFGTPLIVFDKGTFTARARAFASALAAEQIFYAGKSFCCVAVCELVRDLGLGLDVCTGGELATAVAAGFPPERIIFHGNNKSAGELRAARDSGVGRIVVDSFVEIDRLVEESVATKILVRITPGVEAHTHEFVQTGQEDSKFGFTVAGGIALDALRKALEVPGCKVVGVHAHIGSQIFELAAFDLAVKRIALFLDEAREELGFEAHELNLGGGFGIAHTGDEMTLDPDEVVARVRGAVEREFETHRLPVPATFFEPGRAMVGAAGVTLYRVGTVKRIPGVRTYVSVDGGMSDNIRPALYGARYEAVLANRMSAAPGPRVSVAGKHCESGDLLIRDVHLPDDVAPGDLLCVPATGAYTYAMASNYNRVPRPPVVMVENGRATEIVARETHLDLLRLDRRADGSTL
ncbi:MAG TPA: diaminopimelate decarboxylase [Actinomycetota bacterium]|nr:diaminopimelate decarboxylase [Actinomycetota bacterium]